MSQVNTVRGPVRPDALGRTLMHEHIFVLSPEIEKTVEEWDEEDQQARAVAKLRELKQRGIDTLVDLTVVGLGRYIPRIATIAQQVPEINVVVATGVYTYNEVPMYFHFRGPGTILGGPEPMVDLFVREIRDGIADTGVRAGILKCASDRPGLTPGVERVLRAVAQAHRVTGVPITTHTPTPPEPWGLEQQRIFRQRFVSRLRPFRSARHHPRAAGRCRCSSVRAGPRRTHRALARRHVLRRLVPPIDRGRLRDVALDLHLRRGPACDARTGNRGVRHHDHADRQPQDHPLGRSALLMRSRAGRLSP